MYIIHKDIREAIHDLSDGSIRSIITSPPYYRVRDYQHPNQIGLESTPEDYISQLVQVFEELKGKLTFDGNLFVNLGDKYDSNKNLMLIPSRFAVEMINQGWILRNKIIWYKPNHQPSPVRDRLTNTYEEIFHFVKTKKYYYDLDAIRIPQLHNQEENKKVYLRFQKKILDSSLTTVQQQGALQELERLYQQNQINKDARLKLNGTHKALFGANTSLSGRAKELESKGYYFHCNHPKGKNRGDVFSINIKSHKGVHEAVFPEELVEPLIKVGSAVGDVVFDPFAGTGTTCRIAERLDRVGVGVELNPAFSQDI